MKNSGLLVIVGVLGIVAGVFITMFIGGSFSNKEAQNSQSGNSQIARSGAGSGGSNAAGRPSGRNGQAGGQRAGARSGAGRGGGNRGRGRQRGGYAPAVIMVAAEEASITKTVNVLGQARALKSVAVTSEVTGLVGSIDVAPGKRVKKGDVLLRIDSGPQSATLTRIRAQYPIAKANADRYRKLADENAGSALEAEQAFNALKSLEAELRSAEFALEQRTIKAAFDGIAGITTIEEGDYIRAGDMVTTLDDMSAIVIEFSVPQESAAYVALDQAVQVRLTSGTGLEYDGVITAIDSRIDSVSRTLRVEATVSNENGYFLPGAVFAVSTASEGERAVAVPGLAVQWDRNGAYVWKRGDDGVAVRAAVNIAQRTDDIVLVEGDVLPGDAVVADGSDRVRAGIPLAGLERLFKKRKPGKPRATSGQLNSVER